MGSEDDCPEEAPVCSEWGYCQCASYQPGGPECGPGFDEKAANSQQNNGEQICGEGQGACCAGSNEGCPPEAPVCSEYGYCQCAEYQPGGPECGPGFDDKDVAPRQDNGNGGICGTGQGACCAGSNDGCPSEAPVCSEWGYCQCASYKPGDPECGPGFDDVPENSQATENDGLGFGDSASNNKGGDTQGNGGQVCGEGQGACCAGSNDGCPSEAPVCSEFGYCQCAEYQPGGPECGPGFDDFDAQNPQSSACEDPECNPGFDDIANNEIIDQDIDMLDYDITPRAGADMSEDDKGTALPRSDSNNQICGEGQGACCAGSNDGCPSEAPVCSEYGYCQCASYKPGDPECGPGFGDSASNNKGGETQGNQDQICGEGQGSCCAGSNDGCPPEAPVCSEWGYCQCAEYQPGDPECGPGFPAKKESRRGRSGRKSQLRKGLLGRKSNRGKSGNQVRASRRGKSSKQRKTNRRGKSSRSKQGRPRKQSRRNVVKAKKRQG